jgi:hypothetical protein
MFQLMPCIDNTIDLPAGVHDAVLKREGYFSCSWPSSGGHVHPTTHTCRLLFGVLCIHEEARLCAVVTCCYCQVEKHDVQRLEPSQHGSDRPAACFDVLIILLAPSCVTVQQAILQLAVSLHEGARNSLSFSSGKE